MHRGAMRLVAAAMTLSAGSAQARTTARDPSGDWAASGFQITNIYFDGGDSKASINCRASTVVLAAESAVGG